MKYLLSIFFSICFVSVSQAEFPRLEFNLSCELSSDGQYFMTHDFEEGTYLHRTSSESRLQLSHIAVTRSIIYFDISRISGKGSFFGTGELSYELFEDAVADILELDMDYSNFQLKYRDHEMLRGDLECKKVDKNLF